MQPVWRYDEVKTGKRYREFWQCDVDVVGPSSMMADAECLSIVEIVANKLGIKAEIKVNNRKLLNGILEYMGIPKNKLMTVILSIDKLEKIGETGVKEELKEKGIEKDKINKTLKLLETKGSNEKILSKLKKIENKDAE